MLQDSAVHAQEDMQSRALREQQLEATQLIEAVQAALDQDGAALLTDTEQQSIRAKVATLIATASSADQLAIKRAVTQLNEATVAFAQMRMDKSMSGALMGHNISELDR
jgi:molecular chaperone HscA